MLAFYLCAFWDDHQHHAGVCKIDSSSALILILEVKNHPSDLSVNFIKLSHYLIKKAYNHFMPRWIILSYLNVKVFLISTIKANCCISPKTGCSCVTNFRVSDLFLWDSPKSHSQTLHWKIPFRKVLHNHCNHHWTAVLGVKCMRLQMSVSSSSCPLHSCVHSQDVFTIIITY